MIRKHRKQYIKMHSRSHKNKVDELSTACVTQAASQIDLKPVQLASKSEVRIIFY